ncbi:MAG: hypothetical protein V5A87_02865, partial [Candidatus Bipolaricaulota bacterium]
METVQENPIGGERARSLDFGEIKRSEPRSERAISPLGKLIPGFVERFPKIVLHIKCYTMGASTYFFYLRLFTKEILQ